MKTQTFKHLLGGLGASQLSPDAARGVQNLGRLMQEESAAEELFETAIRQASDEELRKLARWRMEEERSRYLD